MFTIIPMLACRGPVLSNGDVALLFSLLAGWVLAAILSLVNGVFILRMPQKGAKICHGFIFAVYIGLAFLLYNLAFSGIQSVLVQEAGVALVFAIPMAVIGHFGWLLRARRKQKQALAEAGKSGE